eukprot:TRINITY_DN11683_c0_g1_i1.p1 TRINITY_DN11683_c0_g1~~TRINITY_DN11683_c0_g1_i1.p1  ORF type:complete len:289 (+),score=55.92 TRINITY_DN11683_c0_g1_i1:54-920(+)
MIEPTSDSIRPPQSLVEELANDVIANIGMTALVEQRAAETIRRGKQAVRDFQVQQNDLNKALADAVERCNKSQQLFQDENVKLLRTIQALISTIAPYSTSTASMWTDFQIPSDFWRQPQVPTSTSDFSFTITLRKADGFKLGLTLSHDELGKELLVEDVTSGGAIDAWNRQCGDEDDSGAGPSRAVMSGDRIVAVNGCTNDAQAMLSACSTKALLRISFVRSVSSPPSKSTAAHMAVGPPPGLASPPQQRQVGAVAGMKAAGMGTPLRPGTPAFVSDHSQKRTPVRRQ